MDSWEFLCRRSCLVFALMIFGTEGNGVQVEFVMRQNQVWSIQGRIKIPSRKAMSTLRIGMNWVA